MKRNTAAGTGINVVSLHSALDAASAMGLNDIGKNLAAEADMQSREDCA